MHRKSGFTLIEMLIVIAVIGILASIVLVGLGPIQKQARDSRRVSDLRQVQTALEIYNTKNSGYYAYETKNGSWAAFTAAVETGAGVGRLPDDPTASQHYQYDGTATTYVLGATLEDASSSVLNNSYTGASPHGDIPCNTKPTYCVQF
ncbi:MAG TPA: type II secretion system protein [Candidatus Paceibacterota bacterium]|nr:type II secretion system protein [Candidatus Paceibacterota bacterium]